MWEINNGSVLLSKQPEKSCLNRKGYRYDATKQSGTSELRKFTEDFKFKNRKTQLQEHANRVTQ